MNHTELDHQAIAFIDPKLLKIESELYGSKWWDYRLMHPVTATRAFMKAYVDAVKNYLKKQIDLYIGMNARVLKQEDLFLETKTTITGLWKARQIADKHGIPYEFWCNRAMDYADECCWPYYPKPSHLYSEKVKETAGSLEGISMVEFVVSKWEEWRRANTLLSSDEFYQPSQYVEHIYQKAHLESLVKQIKRSSQPEFALAIHIFEKQRMSIEQASEFFETSIITRAKKIAD